MDYSTVSSTLGQVMRARREELGLTREQLERELDIPFGQLYRWERGRKFAPESLLRLMVRYGITAAEIVTLLDADEEDAAPPDGADDAHAEAERYARDLAGRGRRRGA